VLLYLDEPLIFGLNQNFMFTFKKLIKFLLFHSKYRMKIKTMIIIKQLLFKGNY